MFHVILSLFHSVAEAQQLATSAFTAQEEPRTTAWSVIQNGDRRAPETLALPPKASSDAVRAGRCLLGPVFVDGARPGPRVSTSSPTRKTREFCHET